MELKEFIKAAILAKVNHDMRERDRSVQSIWYAMEGKMLSWVSTSRLKN